MSEIKAAFRQLAKLYHPDKNPEGIEHFTKILKAYETLSDPALKASYDYKLNYHQAQTQQQTRSTTTTKNWKFDERELKRRQYYNEHIKKYAKQTSEYMAEASTKKNYNEFKYILFATPLAVILFLLIMNLATRDKLEVINSNIPPKQEQQSKLPEDPVALKTGDMPYSAAFGNAVYDSLHNKTLKVKNISGLETIVCLFSKEEFVRCVYINDSSSTEIPYLPPEPLYVYYSSGAKFDPLFYLKEAGVTGSFTQNQAFYKSLQASQPLGELTLQQGDNEGFEKTNEKEFFKYAKR